MPVKLPPAWRGLIPPQPVNIVTEKLQVTGSPDVIEGTRPVWNETWLLGLEQFVRRVCLDIVSEQPKADEPAQAPVATDGKHRPYVLVTGATAIEFERDVNSLIDKGYQPLGGITVRNSGGSLIQTMWKEPVRLLPRGPGKP